MTEAPTLDTMATSTLTAQFAELEDRLIEHYGPGRRDAVMRLMEQVLRSSPRVLRSSPRVLHSGPRVLRSSPRVLHSGPRVLRSGPRVLRSGPRILRSGGAAGPFGVLRWGLPGWGRGGFCGADSHCQGRSFVASLRDRGLGVILVVCLGRDPGQRASLGTSGRR